MIGKDNKNCVLELKSGEKKGEYLGLKLEKAKLQVNSQRP
jgi:hypothetical protein